MVHCRLSPRPLVVSGMTRSLSYTYNRYMYLGLWFLGYTITSNPHDVLYSKTSAPRARAVRLHSRHHASHGARAAHAPARPLLALDEYNAIRFRGRWNDSAWVNSGVCLCVRARRIPIGLFACAMWGPVLHAPLEYSSTGTHAGTQSLR